MYTRCQDLIVTKPNVKLDSNFRPLTLDTSKYETVSIAYIMISKLNKIQVLLLIHRLSFSIIYLAHFWIFFCVFDCSGTCIMRPILI